MYSTWLSVLPRGYCERTLRRRGASAFHGWDGGLDKDDCGEETPVPVEGVFDFELGSDVMPVSEIPTGG
jgi:hypothetical protein